MKSTSSSFPGSRRQYDCEGPGLEGRVMEAIVTGYNPKATALFYNFYYQCTEDGKWGTKKTGMNLTSYGLRLMAKQ